MHSPQQWIGEHIFGCLHSADASGGLHVPMFDLDGDQRHLGELHHLNVADLSIIAVAQGDTYCFWDLGDIELAITTATAATNIFTVAGDLTERLAVGSTFFVYLSTGNDAEYTVTVITYDPGTNLTSITVAAFTDNTDDGTIACTYFPIASASSGSNLFTIAGDHRRTFKIGRLFLVQESTANDLADADYAVTNISYSATTGATTITVASVTGSQTDGWIIPQVTAAAVLPGKTMVRGTYIANSGHSKDFKYGSVRGQANHALYAVAANGVVDVEFHALLEKNIAKTGPVGGPGHRIG